MPRPSRNLTRVSVFLPADALDGLDAKAAQLTAHDVPATRSDVIRLAVDDYLRKNMSDQSEADQQAGLRRFTSSLDEDCDRCGEVIYEGHQGARVAGASRIPWVVGTVLCSTCADRMAEKYGER